MKIAGWSRLLHYPLAVAMQLATLKFRLALSAIAGTTPGMVLFIPAVILSGYFVEREEPRSA